METFAQKQTKHLPPLKSKRLWIYLFIYLCVCVGGGGGGGEGQRIQIKKYVLFICTVYQRMICFSYKSKDASVTYHRLIFLPFHNLQTMPITSYRKGLVPSLM